MMREASAKGRPWTLLYCNRRSEDAPFLKEIHTLGGEVSLHRPRPAPGSTSPRASGRSQPDTAVYCCGPERLMTAVEEATAAWPEGSVHFEWFAPRSRPARRGLRQLRGGLRSLGLTLTVPPEKSVLESQRSRHRGARSCQQGICGTCEVRVISGEVDHRDSILSAPSAQPTRP